DRGTPIAKCAGKGTASIRLPQCNPVLGWIGRHEGGEHSFKIRRRERRKVLHAADLRILDYRAAFIHKADRRNRRPISGLIVFQDGKSHLLSLAVACEIDKGMLLEEFFIAFRDLRSPENNEYLR